MSAPDLPPLDPRARAFIAVAAGYVAACMATVLGFFGTGVVLGGGSLPLAQVLAMIPFSFGFVIFAALPGWCVIRTGLWWAGRRDWPSFMVAAGLNGVAVLPIMAGYDWLANAIEVRIAWEMLAWLVPLGLWAGWVCWVVERWITRMTPQARLDQNS